MLFHLDHAGGVFAVVRLIDGTKRSGWTELPLTLIRCDEAIMSGMARISVVVRRIIAQT